MRNKLILNSKCFDNFIFWLYVQYKKSSELMERAGLLKKITETMSHRAHLDNSIEMIGMLLFGPQNGRSILHSSRGRGFPLVDDWECLKSTVCMSYIYG